MRAALRRRLLLAARSDANAVLTDGVWSTRCLHCRSALQPREDGEALGSLTLEHVVPGAWFGRNAARVLTARVGGDPDDARNPALACARCCNHGTGKGHDARGPGDPRARKVVDMLLQTRLRRWRNPQATPGL